jgi:4-amino-4-deoxy-L-arabinose transferase-like glycosyltransferase
LAKGLVPLVFAVPVVLLCWRQWRPWVSCVAVAAPWYAACWIANGRPFFDEFIWRHHVLRFFTPELQHVQPVWFYLPVLLGLMLPWAPAVLAIRIEKEERPWWLTLGFGILFLSVSRNKLATYLLPLLPSLAILIAPRLRRWHFAFAAGLLVLLPIAGPWIGVAIEQGLTKADFGAGRWWWGAAVPVFAYVAWRWRMPAVVAAFAIAVTAIKWQAFPEIAGSGSAKAVWQKGQPSCLPEGASRSLRYGLNYYAGRELPPCSNAQIDLPPLEKAKE